MILLCRGGVVDGLFDDELCCVTTESEQLKGSAHLRQLGVGVHEG